MPNVRRPKQRGNEDRNVLRQRGLPWRAVKTRSQRRSELIMMSCEMIAHVFIGLDRLCVDNIGHVTKQQEHDAWCHFCSSLEDF